MNLQLNNLLRGIRRKTNLNQDQMAHLMGVSLRTYQRYESGVAELSINQFLRVLQATDRSLFMETIVSLELNFDSDSGRKDYFGDQIFSEAVISKVAEKPAISGGAEFLEKVQKPIPLSEVKDSLCGYWDWNLDRLETFWSSEGYTIYSQPLSAEINSDDTFSRVSPEDMPGIKRGIEDLIKRDISYHNRHRVRTEDGRYFVVNASANKIVTDGETIVFGIAKAYLRDS